MNQPTTALILIHGAGLSAATWPPAFTQLPGLTTVALDLPGHGSSPGPGRRTIGHYADAVLAQLRNLRPASYVVAGHSMGGAIALELARRRAPGLHGLILLATAARLLVSASLLTALSDDFGNAALLISKLSFAADAPQSLRDDNTDGILRSGRTTTLGDYMACNKFDLSSDLPAIDLPVMMISGTADRMVGHRHSAATAAAMPNASFHALDGIGYTPMREAPDVVAGLMTRFLHEI